MSYYVMYVEACNGNDCDHTFIRAFCHFMSRLGRMFTFLEVFLGKSSSWALYRELIRTCIEI